MTVGPEDRFVELESKEVAPEPVALISQPLVTQPVTMLAQVSSSSLVGVLPPTTVLALPSLDSLVTFPTLPTSSARSTPPSPCLSAHTPAAPTPPPPFVFLSPSLPVVPSCLFTSLSHSR